MRAPLGELFFVFGGALAGFIFFFFDLGGFRFQFGLRGFHFFVARVGIHHQLENLVFGGGDLFFRKLNLVQQRLVLLVGFYVERLVAVFGNLAAEIGDCGFVFAAGSFVGFDGGLSFFQLQLGVGQLVFDGGDAFGEFGDFILQAANFLIRFLQAQQVFYFWKHPEGLSFDSNTRKRGFPRGRPAASRHGRPFAGVNSFVRAVRFIALTFCFPGFHA